MKEIFVISDLHIGGAATADNSDRGFRICTHTDILSDFIYSLCDRKKAFIELVINGDMVDFLAERDFAAFTIDPKMAVQKLKNIVEREFQFFDSLQLFLATGHQLTILLGNHDIELALPDVQAYLRQVLKAERKNFNFVLTDTPYIVGNGAVLIEHGNRYDEWNWVDYGALHKLMAQQARGEKLSDFRPPKGSRMVEMVINPVKEKYRFIDLLKPETQAVLPILLALEPSSKNKISTILSIYANFRGTEERSEDQALDDELYKVLGDEVEVFKEHAEVPITTRETSERGTWEVVTSFVDLLLRKDSSRLEKRLPALHKALSVLQNDQSFNLTQESLKEYLEAAQRLSEQGFKYIIFGHTHFARNVELSNGARYFNAGTWADLMQIPIYILNETDYDTAMQLLEKFMNDLLINQVAQYTIFKPTYVYIELDNGGDVVNIDLKEYVC